MRRLPRFAPFNRAGAVLATAAVGGALFVAPPAHAQQTVSLAEYERLLNDYKRIANKNKPSDAETVTLAQKLRAIKSVTRANGKKVTVDLSLDADTLAERPAPTLKKPSEPKTTQTPAQNRAALLTSVVTTATAPEKNGDAKAQAAAILARREFRVQPEDASEKTPAWMQTLRNWFQKQLRAFNRWLRELWERWFPRRSGVNPGAFAGVAYFVRFLLFFAALVAVIVGLYYVFTYVKFGKLGKKEKKGGGLGTGLDLDDLGIADPLAHARALADRSDFREAVRYVYIASLRKLAGSGLVTLQENRTNWEYQRSLRSRSATVYDTLLPGTRLFDRIWYGRQNASRSEYESVVSLYDALPDAPPSTSQTVTKSTNKTTDPPPSANGNGVNPW